MDIEDLNPIEIQLLILFNVYRMYQTEDEELMIKYQERIDFLSSYLE